MIKLKRVTVKILCDAIDLELAIVYDRHRVQARHGIKVTLLDFFRVHGSFPHTDRDLDVTRRAVWLALSLVLLTKPFDHALEIHIAWLSVLFVAQVLLLAFHLGHRHGLASVFPCFLDLGKSMSARYHTNPETVLKT